MTIIVILGLAYWTCGVFVATFWWRRELDVKIEDLLIIALLGWAFWPWLATEMLLQSLFGRLFSKVVWRKRP